MISPHRFGASALMAGLLLTFWGSSAGPASGQSLTFYGRRDFSSRSSPQGLASGHFNGDTFLDLAVVNHESNNVSIFLGTAQRTFVPHPTAPTVAAGNRPKAIVVADFNGDSRADLAVTNNQSNSVSILEGVGNGTFTARPTVLLPAGANPEGLVAGQFTNSDVFVDLVVANFGANNLSFLRGAGNGTFTVLAPVSVGMRPIALAAGLLNTGPQLDLVVTNFQSNALTVLLGRGDGTFQTPATSIAVPNGPRAVAIANFNPAVDNFNDIIVASFTSKSFTVLRGRGDGTFFPPATVDLYSRPTALTVADFNGDQRLDVAISTVEDMDVREQAGVSVFLGNGDMTFLYFYELFQGFTSYAIAAVTFAGQIDLITTSSAGHTVSLWRGGGDGTFAGEFYASSGLFPAGVASGDFNRDNTTDAVVACAGEDSVMVYQGTGDGFFLEPRRLLVGAAGARLDPTAVALGDFNRDNIPDIAVANAWDGSVAVLRGLGGGMFAPFVRYMISTTADPRAIAVADMNADGFLDIVTANFEGNSVSVLKGRMDGTFDPPVTISVGAMTNPRALAIQDLDFDGCPDVVTANFGTGTASVLFGQMQAERCTGNLVTPSPMTTYPTGPNPPGPDAGPHGIAIDDFNWDGLYDVAVSNANAGTVAILMNRLDAWGMLSPARTITVGGGPTGTATTDFNWDGYADIVVTNSFSNNIAVLLGVGDGTFRNPEFFGTAGGPIFVSVNDFFTDGLPDVVTANAYSGVMSILINLTFY